MWHGGQFGVQFSDIVTLPSKVMKLKEGITDVAFSESSAKRC